MQKKEFPLQLLISLQAISDRYSSKVNVVRSEEYLLLLTEKDKESDFYFKIINFGFKNGKIIYEFVVKPISATNILGSGKQSYYEADVLTQIDVWIDILDKYNRHYSLFDGLIEFYGLQMSFKKEETDDNILTEQENALILTIYDRLLMEVSANQTEENKQEAGTIIAEIEVARRNVSHWSKWNIKTNILKIGKLCSDYLPELKKGVVIELLLEAGKHLIGLLK